MAEGFTPYAITEGGLLRRFERALRITRGDNRDWLRRSVAFVSVGYLLPLVPAIAWGIISGEWFPALGRFETHVRPLVAVPLLFAAEPLVEQRARDAGRYLVASGIAHSSLDACRGAEARTAAWRDSLFSEVALLVIAIVTSFWDATYLRGTASLFSWGTLPLTMLFRFLILRWLWRWLLWTLFLFRLSRAPLTLHATHPDRVAGLGPLLGPSHAAWPISAAAASAIAATAADLAILTGQPVTQSYDVAITYVFLAVLLSVLPGLVFAPQLYKIRKYGLRRYGAFAHRFVRAFEARWFDAPGKDALGAPDISSLNDLGGSFQVVTEVRIFGWSRRIVQSAALGALIPMVPLVLMQIAFADLVVRIVKDVM